MTDLFSLPIYKIEVYLPEEALEEVIAAIHDVGAGVLGNYDHVFASTHVTGHWRPLEGSNPYLGEIGEIKNAAEIKIEVNCKRELVQKTVAAIRNAHPYEEPLIQIIPILNDFFQ